jgi:hypothetical protein
VTEEAVRVGALEARSQVLQDRLVRNLDELGSRRTDVMRSLSTAKLLFGACMICGATLLLSRVLYRKRVARLERVAERTPLVPVATAGISALAAGVGIAIAKHHLS